MVEMVAVPIIRPARKEDINQVVEIETMWKTTPGWKRPQFEQELESSDADVSDKYMVVAALPDKSSDADVPDIVGYSGLKRIVDEGHVTTIAVHPSRTRQGIGKALLTHIIEKSRAMQMSSLHLEVDASNGPAIRLYKAHGFGIVGRRPNFYNKGRDALLMKLDL